MNAKRRPSKRKAKPPQEEFTTFELENIRRQIASAKKDEPLELFCPFCHHRNVEGQDFCCDQFRSAVKLIVSQPVEPTCQM